MTTDVLNWALLVAALSLPLWGILDIARSPDAQWEAIGHKKLVWIALLGGGMLFLGILGMVFAGIYFTYIRPKLRAASSPEEDVA
ncbi:MAG: DUF2516 family protein [Acidimicrobiia bacterium]